MSEIKRIHPDSQENWRKWLEENHSKEKEVYLIHYKKHTSKRAMSSQEAMDEAICFGWIDTTMKRLDKDRYMQKFVRRKKTGNWSKNTIKYAKRLIKEGKMTPAGLRAYKLGLKRELIDVDISTSPETLQKLKQALAKNKKAEGFFNKVAPSHRRMWLRWLVRAKREKTKEARIAKILHLCSEERKF